MSVPLGFLGPEGSFTHQAALQWASSNPGAWRLVAWPTVVELLLAAERGEADAVVCPVENSLEGSIQLVGDMLLQELTLFMCGEVVVPVEHHILVRPGVALERVERLLSHPQALAQCRRTLAWLLPGVPHEQVASTAEAARLVAAATDRAWAAVAGAAAGERFGLVAVARAVQDDGANATRFGVFGRCIPPPSGRDKTSVVLGSLEDRPGLLHELLAEFARRGINLTRIESRPSREAPGRYLFLIDFEGHHAEGTVQAILATLRRRVGYLRWLGSYPRATGWDGTPARG